VLGLSVSYLAPYLEIFSSENSLPYKINLVSQIVCKTNDVRMVASVSA
jgi:hypothetical protein